MKNDFIIKGETPTALPALTGLFTPPGICFSLSLNNSSDLIVINILTPHNPSCILSKIGYYNVSPSSLHG